MISLKKKSKVRTASNSSILKLNKNKFPLVISHYLNSSYYLKDEDRRNAVKLILNGWYKKSFQKNNRWNRTSIYSVIKNYSEEEISELRHCFKRLFDTNRKYNQVFLKYVGEFIEKQKAGELGLFIKIDQKGYEELLSVIGELKRSGNIQSDYKEIAKVIFEFIQADNNLKISTILDRLRNKKGYT